MVEYLCQRLEKARRDSMRAGVGLLPFDDCSRTWICVMRSKWQSFLPVKSGNFFRFYFRLGYGVSVLEELYVYCAVKGIVIGAY